jgi:hypothetical protein
MAIHREKLWPEEELTDAIVTRRNEKRTPSHNNHRDTTNCNVCERHIPAGKIE